MNVHWSIDDCQFDLTPEEAVKRMDADTHDPWSAGVFSCPCCGKVHYVNEVNGVTQLGQKVKVVFIDGLVDCWLHLCSGDSQ